MFQEVELHRLRVSRHRQRRALPWPSPVELDQIKGVGIVAPVTVRPIPGSKPPDYEILAGLKTWLGAQRAELPTVPVYIRADLTDEDAKDIVRQETGQELDPITEAETVKGFVDEGLPLGEAGQLMGRSRTVATHLLRLLRLPPEIRRLLRKGIMTAGQARPLVTLDRPWQLKLARRIQREGLSAREVEQLANDYRAGKSSSTAGKRRVRGAGKDADILQLESAVSELIGCAVDIDYDAPRKRGRLHINFHNLDVLDGVLERLGYQPS